MRTGELHIQATPPRREAARALRALAAWLRAALLMVVLAGPDRAFAQQLSLRHYGKPEGLDNLNVNCMLQATDGFLWACTENGLFRYDGQRFQRFGENDGLENTLVYTAVQDAAGRLWAGTSSDLFVGEGGRFQAVRPQGQPLRTTPETILAPLPDGTLALAIRGQVVRVFPGGAGWRSAPMFTPSQLATLPELAKVGGLYAGPDGHLWLGCGLDICDAAQGEVHRHSRAQGVPPDHWRSFAVDAAGDLWARGSASVARRKRGEQAFVMQAAPNARLRASVDLAPIVAASDGSVVMRVDKGIARWRDGTWRLWTSANGLPTSDITTLAFDHEGALWFGLVGRGASRLVGYGRIESWTIAQGLDSDVVWSVLRRDDGSLLASTTGSCRSLARGAVRLRPCALPGLPAGEIGALAQDGRGTLWIGFRAGELWALERHAPAARFVARLPHFTTIFVDSRERLWVPTRGGVFLKLPREAVPQRVSDDHEFLDAAEDAQGGIWVAGSDGLLRFTEGSWKHAALADRRAAPGFASLAIDGRGVMWAASRSRGVMRAVLDGDDLREQRWIEDPLVANASPMFIRTDTTGRIWVGTDYGVVVHEVPATGRADPMEWQRLTETDGLVWNDVNQSSFAADPDGSVWIGTSGGLSHIVDPARALARKPLQVQLGDGRFAGRHFVPAGSQRWEWSPTSALDLDLVSLNFSRSIDSVYRYRVAGIDADWFESGNPRVHYPALEPGRYRFEASLVDPDRRQSSPVVGFDFEVLPPWWRSGWFRGLCIAAGLLGLLAAWRWQLRRITARHMMERQIAKERHVLLERASRDSLTGLWNRASILDLLNEAVARRAPGTVLGVAVIDVDHFKRVNDEHGHAAGDIVLKELAQRLSASLRQSDLLGRYGGEELLLVLPAGAGEPLVGMVERLREAVCRRPFSLGGRELEVTVSIGVSWLGAPAAGADTPTRETAQQAFERADAALYEAKRAGRNRVVHSASDQLEARRDDD